MATFLVGTQNPISWEGILHSVGNNYLVIFQPDQGRYITGDLYALKFVEFSDSAPGVVPPCTGYRRRDGQQILCRPTRMDSCCSGNRPNHAFCFCSTGHRVRRISS